MQPEFGNTSNDNGTSVYGALDFIRRLIEDSTDEEKADFLQKLHERGETPEEVVELSKVLRDRATLSRIEGVSDIVGTGGDGKDTINVSTAASFVVSSTGIKIAKHGNFGATSNRGSADFLKHLGYNFEMSQRELERRLKEDSFAFILAPMYNDSFARFAMARKMLPFKTIFNYLGPLTNPSDPDTLMLGVTDAGISRLYTDYLLMNSKSGCVVYSEDGMDEISPYSISNITFVRGGESEQKMLEPFKLLKGKIPIEKISSKDPVISFELTRNGLKGTDIEISKFIALNSALSMVVNGAMPDMEEAFAESLRLLKSGYVAEHVAKIVGDSR